MNVPLTNAVLGAMREERSGIASALLNNSREVAGLLGITVVGAVLRSRHRPRLPALGQPGGGSSPLAQTGIRGCSPRRGPLTRPGRPRTSLLPRLACA
jgi:hypothetical protein